MKPTNLLHFLVASGILAANSIAFAADTGTVASAVATVSKPAVAPAPAPKTLTPALSTVVPAVASIPAAPLTAAQVEQVKQVIHDYLVTSPEVLVEASQSLQKQEAEKVEKKAHGAIVQNANALFADPASPVAGNPQGDVTLVEFFDYQCPHCKEMAPVLEKLKASDPKLRIVYKELPIFGSSSRDASAAVLAAKLQNQEQSIKLHTLFLSAQAPLTQDKIKELAKSVGLDVNKLTLAMASDAVKKQLDDNFKLAQALGLMGTPTFIIAKWQVGGQNNLLQHSDFLPGMLTVETLQGSIAQARKASAAQ